MTPEINDLVEAIERLTKLDTMPIAPCPPGYYQKPMNTAVQNTIEALCAELRHRFTTQVMVVGS